VHDRMMDDGGRGLVGRGEEGMKVVVMVNDGGIPSGPSGASDLCQACR